MIIGERLKKARKDKKLTQQELGDMLGVSKVSICGYETGTRVPTMDNFIQLLDILEVKPDYLLGREASVICDDEEDYSVRIAKDDLDIINEFKKYANLYNKLIADHKRTVELINRRMKNGR